MPLTLYKTFASLRLFTCLVYVSTYCVPIAHLRQNKPFPLLYLGGKTRNKRRARTNALRPLSKSQYLVKEGILDMARENAHFQQHEWRYFAFKHLLRYSDDRILPLVEKICEMMLFGAANRLRVDKVRTFSCFSVHPLLRIVKGVIGVTK